MQSCKIEKQAVALHHPGEEFTFINFEIQAFTYWSSSAYNCEDHQDWKPKVICWIVIYQMDSARHPFKQMGPDG